MIDVLVVSPVPAVRAGLERMLEGEPGLAVASGAWEEGRRLPVRDLKVVLLCQEPLWRTVAGQLLAGGAPGEAPGLVLLSDDATEQRALAGTLGSSAPWAALPQAVSPEELAAAVRAVAAGLHVVHPTLLELLSTAGPDGEAAESLTERERGILDLLSRGYTNPEIAAMVGISENTVKFHTSSLYQKLGVANRTEAVRAGIRAGAIHL